MARNTSLAVQIATAVVGVSLILLGFMFYNNQQVLVSEAASPIVSMEAKITTNTITGSTSSIIQKPNWKSAFDRTRQEAARAASLIYERYEFSNRTYQQYFNIIWNMPDYAWDILKYKIATKLFRPDSRIDMIFTGSSVTAGYDNYYNQSYPIIFEKTVRRTFDYLGLPLHVANIAQHRINCKLHTYCIHSIVNTKSIDFLGWENTYGCGRVRDTLEFAARLASQYQAVLYVSASGGMTPHHCAPSKDPIPWISETFRPANLSRAIDIHLNRTFPTRHRREVNSWYADSYSVGKFTRFLNKKYKGIGVHGFNMWARSRALCQPITPPLNPNATGCEANELFRDMCQSNGGPHFMTMEAALRSMDGQIAKGWNPSAGMHRLRGELLAYHYLIIVLDALAMVEQDMTHLLPDLILQSKYILSLFM